MFKKKQKKEAKRIVKYLISGGAWFWSGYITFFLLDRVLGLNLWWAKQGANLVGWTVNYILQRFWAFNNPNLAKHKIEVTSRYIFVTLMQFIIDYLIVAGLKRVGLTPYLGQFVSAGFFTVWNYLWYRFFVFPERFSKKRA